MEKKEQGPFFFSRLKKKGSASIRSLKFKSFGFRSKTVNFFRLWFVDGFLFKILSVFEAVFLLSRLCFFYLCCGCHI